MIRNEHNRHSRNLPKSSLQIFIASGYYESAPLFYSVDNAIISVSSFVIADQSFKTGIFGKFECEPISMTELLELSDDTVSEERNAL